MAVTNPAAGRYLVVVDGFRVPSGSTEFDYRDVITSTAYGSLDVPTTPLDIAGGDTESLSGTLTPSSLPGAGRVLLGTLGLTAEGTTLGRAEVLTSVTEP